MKRSCSEDRLRTPSTRPTSLMLADKSARASRVCSDEPRHHASDADELLQCFNRPAGTSDVPPIPSLVAEAGSAQPKPAILNGSPRSRAKSSSDRRAGRGHAKVVRSLFGEIARPRATRPDTPVIATRPSKDGSSSASSCRSRPASPARVMPIRCLPPPSSPEAGASDQSKHSYERWQRLFFRRWKVP